VDALVCVGPGKLRLVERPEPKIDSQKAIVRPLRIGICGTDYHIFEGKHPFLAYPRIMGHELAVRLVEPPPGSVLSPGDVYVVNPYLSCHRCRACRTGKPNCCVNISVLGVHQDGGMAGLLSVPPANLIPAEGLTVDECATVEFLAIGAHAVRRGAPAAGERVIVIGAGPIGIGAALFARLSGVDITIFDRDRDRAKAAQSIVGAWCLSTELDLMEAVREATEGNGFDLVFDATGNQQAMEKGFDFVAHGGRYVLIGVVNDSITFKDPDFHRKEMTLLGSRNATLEDFRRVMSAIRNGDIPVDRLVTHRTTLADAIHDLPLWAAHKTGLIKAMINID
jgi:2-desacetyl-2-hydroxyethyl bacteriochlorophyllide A dehydrogenase